MSRWAITTLILFLATPALGGLAYAFVDAVAERPNNYMYRGIAG